MKYCPLPSGQNWWGILPEEMLKFQNPAPIVEPKSIETPKATCTFLNPAPIVETKHIEIPVEIFTFLKPATIAQTKKY